MTLAEVMLTKGSPVIAGIRRWTYQRRNKFCLSHSKCSFSTLNSKMLSLSHQKFQRTSPKSLVHNHGPMWTSMNLRLFATGFPFRHDENLNAVRLIASLPNYKNLMFQVEDATSEEMLPHLCLFRQGVSTGPLALKVKPLETWRGAVVNFIQASYSSHESQLPVTHPKNQEVVEALLKDLTSVSDEELAQVLFHLRFFAPCPSVNDPQYMNVWKAIDAECKSRSLEWPLDFSFVIADLWFGVGLARFSEFHWTLQKRLFRRCDKLSKEHFVRFMFCLNLNRSIPEGFNSYDLEYRLYKIADDLTVEEVVIIAMAFFKTQTPIRDPAILKKLLAIAMRESQTLDSISVAAVSKLARYCTKGNTGQIMYDFQEKFIPEVPRLSIAACTHLALIGNNSLSPNKELVKLVVQKIADNMADTRLKELERICLAVTLFNVECDKFFELLPGELQKPERADEIRKYGRSLPAILHYLSFKRIFIPDLMSTVLSKTFRHTYYGKDKELFQRELLCLDIAAELELPEYHGNRLEEKTYYLIMRRNMMRLKPHKAKVSQYEMFLRAVTEAVREIVDQDCFTVCNIMPQHHTMAIVYCRDQNGRLAKIPTSFLDHKQYDIKTIQKDTNLNYYALILVGKNMYIWNSDKEMTGNIRLQLRQTKKLGYNVKLVHSQDYEKMLTDLPKLKEHITNIIESEEVF